MSSVGAIEEFFMGLFRRAIKEAAEEGVQLTPPHGTKAPPRLLSLAEAAAAKRKSVGTIRNWISAGYLPSQKSGRTVLVSVADLDLAAARAGQPKTDTDEEFAKRSMKRR